MFLKFENENLINCYAGRGYNVNSVAMKKKLSIDGVADNGQRMTSGDAAVTT